MTRPAFITTLEKTITQWSSYPELIRLPATAAWRFVILSYFFIIMPLIGLKIWWRWIPEATTRLDAVLQEISDHFPETLEFSWDTRRLSLNPPTDPVTIPYPATFPTEAKMSENFALVVPQEIDPNTQTSIDGPLFLITPVDIWIQDAEKQWSSAPLNSILSTDEGWNLNKKTWPQYRQTIKDQFEIITSAARWWLPPLSTLGLLVARLWTILLDVLLVYFLVKILGWKWKFAQLWKVALYALIPAELTAQLGSLLYQQLTVSLFGISFWFIFAWVSYKYRR